MRLIFRGGEEALFVNVLSCVRSGGEERHWVNIIYMCVVCVEDVEVQRCFILSLWICRALEVLVTLELDSQLNPGSTDRCKRFLYR